MLDLLIAPKGKPSYWILAYASVLFVTGCRNEPTTVSGIVTLDGKPLAMHDGMRGTVIFQPTEGDGNSLNANIDSSGRFELANGSNNLVTPAVYNVTVSAVEIIPPSADHPEPQGRRVTPGKYASVVDSGLRIEIKSGPNDIKLPLSSDEGAAPSADPPN